MLTWALVIATYGRPTVLVQCVRLALEQTRPPSQIVVVDASTDWERSRGTVADLVAQHEGVELVYAHAPTPSTSAQRQEGLVLSDGDVSFLLDDDSLMYPDCAEEMMRLYEADVNQQVVAIQCAVRTVPPDGRLVTSAVKEGGSSRAIRRSGPLRRWVLRHVLLFHIGSAFIPYDGHYPDHPAPPGVLALGARPERLLGGFRMTMRTEVGRRVGFDPGLQSYSPGEDVDASYRLSRHGAMLTSSWARVYHHNSALGRIDRRKTETLSTMNQAYFLRRHAPDQAWARRRYFRLALRRVLAQVVKDVGTRRWTLPQVRGAVRGTVQARAIFASTDEALATHYDAAQRRVLGSSSRTGLSRR